MGEFARSGTEKVLPQLKRLDGFEGYLVLANRRSGEIVAVTLWDSEEALRATEGASYWLRAFGAEAAGEAGKRAGARPRSLAPTYTFPPTNAPTVAWSSRFHIATLFLTLVSPQ